MVYLIVYKRTGKRVRHKDGSLTPAMDHYIQADNYIFKHFGNSNAMTIIKK